MKGYFVTGTDTGVGKTWVSAALLHKLNASGVRTVAMKPVASGCVQTIQGLRNDDALLLQHTASVELPYEEVNPYAFEPAIAPHLAAKQAGVEISLQVIKKHYDANAAKAETIIVEGVGGWHVPLNVEHSTVDVARLLQLPVVLVVGMRLGCLNHALLTATAIQNDGMQLAGWLANCIDADMRQLDDNIASLRSAINAPFLGRIPFQKTQDIARMSTCIALG